MKKVKVYYAMADSGDGGAYPMWFLSEDKAEEWEETSGRAYTDSTGSVETFAGSDIHMEAEENEENS